MLLRKIRIYTSAGSLLMIVACGGNKQQQAMAPGSGPVPVTTANVSTARVSYYDDYPGTVVALNQVDLRAQVSGFVTGIYVTDGAKVKKGQKLYTVDPQQYEASYEQAQANLAVQEANLVKAQKDADRYRTLDKQDAIAKQQVDNAEAALQAAQKQVDAAKASIRAVQTNVKYTNVYAPFDGTIGISQVKVGSPVSAGQTILNTVSSDNPIAVDFTVNQNEIYRFIQLQQKSSGKGDSTFRLAFGDDIYPFPGKLVLLDRAVDPQTGMLKVRLNFPNDKNMLKAGMTGKVRVLNNAGTESILIPYKAVTEQLGEFFVYVVGDSSKVNQRKVVLSKQVGTNVIIKDGLKEGDRIVVQGVQNLREGAVIKQADTTAPKKQ